ncbi:hypothetical protein ACJX0J_031512 [Zea mays]
MCGAGSINISFTPYFPFFYFYFFIFFKFCFMPIFILISIFTLIDFFTSPFFYFSIPLSSTFLCFGFLFDRQRRYKRGAICEYTTLVTFFSLKKSYYYTRVFIFMNRLRKHTQHTLY